jgi:multimeric flavodoxin WrbA
MKVLTILGSPKVNGHTARTLDMFEENLAAMGHQAERVHVTDYRINGCLGCGACIMKAEKPACVQKDDAISVFERILAADAVVYASPVYGFDLTAQIKSLIDRHFCLMTGLESGSISSVMKDKRVALLMTAGYPAENNTEHAEAIFDRIFGYLFQCDVAGKYIVSMSNAPDFESRAGKTAREMAVDITKDL